MEKISRIVGNSPRVGSADTTKAPPIRPGIPSFGRPVGNGIQGDVPALSTAQKAGIINQELNDEKKARTEARLRMELNNPFFTRGDVKTSLPNEVPLEGASDVEIPAKMTMAEMESDGQDVELSRFTPRGTLVDIRA